MRVWLFWGVTALTLVFPKALDAAEYYVDADHPSADDSNEGSEEQPWKNCPGMPEWSGTISLSPGDVVYFHNEGTWESSSGNALLQVVGGVTYNGCAWGEGTNTKAVFRATGNLSRSVVNFMDDHPSIPTVVHCFEIDAGGNVTSGVAFNWPHAERDLVGEVKRISNSLVHNVRSSSSQGEYEYGIAVSSGYGGGRTVSNVEIFDCTAHNISRGGINVYSANDDPGSKITDVWVRGCEVYNTGTDPDYGGSGLALKNHIVDVLVEYNVVRSSVNGIGIGISSHEEGFRGPEHAIIRHNIVADHPFVGVNLFVRGDTSIDLYGNIIINNTYQGIRLMGASGVLSWRIYNNTIMSNHHPEWSHEILIGGNDAEIAALEVINNLILADEDTIPLQDQDGDITAHSNNLYFRFGGGALASIAGTIYDESDIASWEANGVTADPQLVDMHNSPWGFSGTFGVDLQPNTDGLNITETSPAVDQGADLGVLFSTSINSVTRSEGAGWDIGAYEFSVSADPPQDGGVPPDSGSVFVDGSLVPDDSDLGQSGCSCSSHGNNGSFGYRYFLSLLMLVFAGLIRKRSRSMRAAERTRAES